MSAASSNNNSPLAQRLAAMRELAAKAAAAKIKDAAESVESAPISDMDKLAAALTQDSQIPASAISTFSALTAPAKKVESDGKANNHLVASRPETAALDRIAALRNKMALAKNRASEASPDPVAPAIAAGADTATKESQAPALAPIPVEPVPATEHILQPESVNLPVPDASDELTDEPAPLNEEDARLIEEEKLWHLRPDIELHPRIKNLVRAPAGLEDDPDQNAAVLGLLHQRRGLLIGAAGTGKTTTVKRIVEAKKATVGWIDKRDYDKRYFGKDRGDLEERLQHSIPAFVFLGFMARSVDQLRSSLPEKYAEHCMTIHNALGYHPEMVYNPKLGKETRQFIPLYNEQRKLPWKLVFIDEAQTVSVELWNNLIKALPKDCEIICMGDIAQIPPPVGSGVIGFLLARWPHYVLDKIHRQKEGNLIIENATRIRRGYMPSQTGNEFGLMKLDDGGISSRRKIVETIKRLAYKGQFDFRQDFIITAMNKGNLGQREINADLVNFFNPPEYDDDGNAINPRIWVKTMSNIYDYAVGDKVMNTKNDNQKGIYNGMIGYITDISPNPKYKMPKAQMLAAARAGDMDSASMLEALDELNTAIEQDSESLPDYENDPNSVDMTEALSDDTESDTIQCSHVITVSFDNRFGDPIVVEFSGSGPVEGLMLAYAFTCHKTLGNECRNAFVVCHSTQSRMLSREWLYTAVTRAKKAVLLMYNDRGLTKAVNTQEISGETIEAKIEKFVEKFAVMEAWNKELLIPDPQAITLRELNLAGRGLEVSAATERERKAEAAAKAESQE